MAAIASKTGLQVRICNVASRSACYKDPERRLTEPVDGANLAMRFDAVTNAWPQMGRTLLSIPGWVALALVAMPTGSMAAPNCMTRILADVPAEESPEQVKSKSNNEFGPVTKIKVNKKTGRMLFCAENSYCYNSNAFEFTSPCRIKVDKQEYFGDYFTYFTR